MNNEPVLIIEAGQAGKNYWPDLWRYRQLLYILSWRDISIRYKNTAFGVLWAVLRPLLTMLAFTLVFGHLANFSSIEGVPYAIFVFVALLPWQFFVSSVSESSNKLLGNASLITKVYFPRIIIPLSAIVTCLVDFLVSLLVLVVLMLYFHCIPSLNIIFLPIMIFLLLCAASGVGLLFSALYVKFPDFRHIGPFILQSGLYLSPVGFNSNIIPENYRFLYFLNPMAGIIDGFRWSILGGGSLLDLRWFGVSMAVVVIVLIIGFSYFRSVERKLADTI